MDPTPQANPSQMLPPSLLRGGQTSPGQIFQQNPLSQNMSPSAMGGNSTVMQQPAPGSQAGNPTMPPGTPPPMAGIQQANGHPGTGQEQLSEAQNILNALPDPLNNTSKLTDKTVHSLSE